MKFYVFASLSLFLLACTVKTTIPNGGDMLGGEFVVESFRDYVDPIKSPTILFDSAADKISGFAGCNKYFGTFADQGGELQIGRLGSTQMACMEDGILKMEHVFLSTLPTAKSYSLDGERLRLYDGSGELVVTATRVASN